MKKLAKWVGIVVVGTVVGAVVVTALDSRGLFNFARPGPSGTTGATAGGAQ